MPYTPDPTNVTQPDRATVKASTAAEEFQALKLYIRDTILSGLNTKAPLANPVFTGTASFQDANFINSPTAPTPPSGDTSSKVATMAAVAAAALSTVLPAAAGNQGLSITSDGVNAGYMYSTQDCLAVINYLGS